MALPDWVRLPSAWIEDHGLKQLRWGGDGKGSDNTAALMALAVIAHHANEKSGAARLTYDVLCTATGLSRSKLSNGLDVLERIGVVARRPEGRSSYKLTGFDPKRGWAKLPAKRLYSSGRVYAFDDFRLRSATELNALKLYFLFVARRGRDTNMANISFDKIEEYTDIERPKIKAATSLLATLALVYVEHVPSNINEYGIANAYRIVGLDSYVHMGTRGRGMEAVDFDGVDLHDESDES
jgi:DNA-binding transcriptional ArsR family regulator